MVDGALRASDADRDRVAERLRRAHDDGRISLLEFDERLGAAYAARTYAELEPLAADLPEDRPGQARVHPRSAHYPARSGQYLSPRLRQGPRLGRCRGGRDGWHLARRVQLAALLAAGLINFVIWLAVSLGSGATVYPWWIWVVGPWGLVLAAEHVVARVLATPRST
jgi:hypothetical protein